MDHTDALIALQDATRGVRFGTLHVQGIALVHYHSGQDPVASAFRFDMEGSPDEHIRDVEAEAQRQASKLMGQRDAVSGVVVKAVGWQFEPCVACINRALNGGCGPRHNASVRCQSGGRTHCACSTCF